MILQPDEETLAPLSARGRAAPVARRCGCDAHAATCRRETADGDCGSTCWPTSSFPHEVEHCLEARGRRHRSLSHRVPLPRPRQSSRPKRITTRPIATWLQAMHPQPGRDSHARSGRRQDAVRSARPKRSRIRFLGCAAFGSRSAICRCFARSCGRSCGPACWATCGSCFR